MTKTPSNNAALTKAISKSVNFRTPRLPASIADGGIGQYIAMVKGLPRLSAQEEAALARKVQADHDLAAAEKLIKANLYLVVAAAFEYKGYGMPMADIISEGNIGLMKAVKKYDPDKGFRLSTYALWWIRATINEFILGSWSLVKLGTQAAQKKLFFGLKRIKAKLGVYHDGDMAPAEVRQVAADLDVPEEDVIDMNRRMARDISLNKPAPGDGGDGLDAADRLASAAPSPAALAEERNFNYYRMKMLLDAIERLAPREQEVVKRRRLKDEPDTLDAIAIDLGVSKERVRQIESGALEKLRGLLAKRRDEIEG
ncbi:MAG: RNA polymerase factor sigma-32 [Rickettsiales bacterium]|jgi:RNA polymerase sigma-32 factor|nr:RNA polymerase factor sigma-32 [Rickettsiales bacterium]